MNNPFRLNRKGSQRANENTPARNGASSRAAEDSFFRLLAQDNLKNR